ncbi:MAG: choice-of-anchor tandem repeat GloVer-containing protein [Terriglobales bacterium]|jgi:uncharacterized repeat protein (TIGR03803 family)
MGRTKLSFGFVTKSAIILAALILVNEASAGELKVLQQPKPETATFNVLWTFAGTPNDAGPPYWNRGVVDSSGNFYGETEYGGANDAGAVFEVSPTEGGGWTETVIHNFGPRYSGDGGTPSGSLLMDKNGNLYGTTAGGGIFDNGTVYKLSPNSEGRWTETILYSFSWPGSGDGAGPSGGVTMDAEGNLYGVTGCGGTGAAATFCATTGNESAGAGTVYKLSPTSSGEWKETVLYSFSHYGKSGYGPWGEILVSGGNLIGFANSQGASDYGLIWELQANSTGKKWTNKTLYTFTGGLDGGEPNADGGSIVADSAGNLYGVAYIGGASNTGAVWELVYSAKTNTYGEQTLYSFGIHNGNDGNYPAWGLTQGRNGVFYGDTVEGGGGTACDTEGCGTVFSLTPGQNGQWEETTIYSFEGGTNGANVGYNGLTMDASGNLYGMTAGGYLGGPKSGEVFEIRP